MKPSKSKSSSYATSSFTGSTPHFTSLTLILEGESSEPNFYLFFEGQNILDAKWQNGLTLETELAINLQDPYYQSLLADKPLIFLLRAVGGKGSKEPDPLQHIDNRAGATVDLFPLVLGQETVHVTVQLVNIVTGDFTGCTVEVTAQATEMPELYKVPLIMTMVSAHCLPPAKDGTVYIAAVGLDGVHDPHPVNFGMSLSTPSASKVVWASACTAGQVGNTALNVPNEDIFIPRDLDINTTSNCMSVYWNSMKRVLVDPLILRDRLSTTFFIELAGVPKTGKVDVRGRYMGFIDFAVLLESNQIGVTSSTPLIFYSEADLPENTGPLLDLPPVSAKLASARETNLVLDESGHQAYVILRFDLMESLTPKTTIACLFETIGFPAPDGPIVPCNELYVDPPEEDPSLDVRKIRKDGGALAVHRELGGLACRGAVPMGQSIKRTAANRLLMRVRTMIKQFPPGDCSYIEWQDTVTRQHAASRRAVTASFAPQPPPPRPPAPNAAARCRVAGDSTLADHNVMSKFKNNANHPSAILSKALVCLEARSDREARDLILRALSAQTKNRFLLWIFGGQDFDKGPDAYEAANAALRLAVKGDYSNGTSNAIGWAAMHALNHYHDNQYLAFIAAKKMRKMYELPREWKKFYNYWCETSGEEEIYWIPTIIGTLNPMVIAAAFFLCLRCYRFTEQLLKCVEKGCATKGARLQYNCKVGPDICYIRTASLLLRRQYRNALEITCQGIKKFGPNAALSQMKTSCLACIHGWNGACEESFEESERAGAEQIPTLLFQAALDDFRTRPKMALQRAARCHKKTPSAHSALLIGRIYEILNERTWAERWSAAAVKFEPMLADGWAFLAILAMRERNVDKARTMIRTANQVGKISPDIKHEMEQVIQTIGLEFLPDALVKDLCLCDYH